MGDIVSGPFPVLESNVVFQKASLGVSLNVKLDTARLKRRVPFINGNLGAMVDWTIFVKNKAIETVKTDVIDIASIPLGVQNNTFDKSSAIALCKKIRTTLFGESVSHKGSELAFSWWSLLSIDIELNHDWN